MPYDKDGKYYRLPTNSVNKNNQSSKKSKKESTNFFKVEKKDKPVDKNKASKKEPINFFKAENKDKPVNKNKASKKEPINFFKAEKKGKIETLKFDWNNKKIKFLTWVFCGIALLYFLNSIFAPSPPSPSRPLIIVPNRSMPFSQPAPVDRCRTCKIMGDCSFVPGCITRQENCQFKFNDITGNWEKNCTSF